MLENAIQIELVKYVLLHLLEDFFFCGGDLFSSKIKLFSAFFLVQR